MTKCHNLYRVINTDIDYPSKARGILVVADSVKEAKEISGRHKSRRISARKIGYSCNEKGIASYR